MSKKPLIVIAGPTASGKSSLAVDLCKRINGSVISADSMQVYKRMDIGSAKITKEEMGGIPHYLVDVLEPWEDFNIVKFKEMARKAMDEIYGEGRIPVIAGGTGFYIQAVTRDIDFSQEDADDIREELSKEVIDQGAQALHARLAAVDPESAEKIHPNNVKRVIRALEFYYRTGKRISCHNEEEKKKLSPYDLTYFVLTMDRAKLYGRIEKRVDEMISMGLVEEVKRLKCEGLDRNMVSMQGLGYKEILEYLEGEIPFEEAVYKIKRDTRHFAKRQLTWFRRESGVIWIDQDEYKDREEILRFMIEKIHGAGEQ